MPRAWIVKDQNGRFYGIQIQCPGCVWQDDGSPSAHVLETDWMPEGMERILQPRPDLWGFNGDLERPTFTPSLLRTSHRWDGEKKVPFICHSYIRDGQIQFLNDCTHPLKGKTVDLPESK